MNNNVVPHLCGFIVASMLSLIVIISTWNSGIYFERNIQMVAVLVIICWFIILIKSKGWDQCDIYKILVCSFIFVTLGIFLSHIWNCGYLSMAPLNSINTENGGIFRDELFHNAIASSIMNYGYPSLLINSKDFYNYHFGSHFILAIISRIIGCPTYFTYCYVYPIIFLPLFPTLILLTSQEVRILYKKNEEISYIDGLFLLVFMTYFLLPETWAKQIEDLKFSFYDSESYCIANVLALWGTKKWIKYINLGGVKTRFDKGRILLLELILLPIITLTKVSVGIILAFIFSYYLFRTCKNSIKNFIGEVGIIAIPFVVHYAQGLIYSPISSITSRGIKSRIMLLAFLRDYISDKSYWGIHFLFMFLFAIIFILHELSEIKSKNNFLDMYRERRTFFLEIIVLSCVICTIPSLFIKINGASAWYFLSIQQIVAIVLVIGSEIPLKLLDKLRKDKNNRIFYFNFEMVLLFCLSLNYIISLKGYAMGTINCCKEAKMQLMESERENSYWSVIKNINSITEGEKKDYYIYICQSANIWNRYEDLDSALFFYPAMTGIECIGVLYSDNGQLYANNGEQKSDGFDYTPIDEQVKMSEEDAFVKAVQDGKKAIIYIYDDTMDIKYVGEKK